MVQQAIFYTNDFAVAEDVVQEVFVRLWEKRDELKGIQNLQGYLLLSVKNRSFYDIKSSINDTNIKLYPRMQ